MERSLSIPSTPWLRERPARSVQVFAAGLSICALLSALLASWAPLQFSIVALFVFAGPHNWFELRYFIMRLPARFGQSRNFFLVAFAGIAVTVSYLSMPALYYSGVWSGSNWLFALAGWNTLLLFWIALLVWMRSRQRPNRDWFWFVPLALALSSLNWLAPELFSLALVYLHPLVALWFLDRHLRRTRPEWLSVYHRSLILIPLLVTAMVWQFAHGPSLADDNGLAWRITQHAGAGILAGVSSHLLVAVHVFLEMLHYAVWIIALPLIGGRGAVWRLKTIPLFSHPHGFPRLVALVLVASLGVVVLLWSAFAIDYSLTRDIYFAVAIAHVLAEVPFLLRTL
ncbi:MAG TPA: hypothetical protein VMM84_15395 [Pyrinomonadaceae bacterium]|nr:hypothetical protein [Pyrinomonadaceae bacterium]